MNETILINISKSELETLIKNSIAETSKEIVNQINQQSKPKEETTELITQKELAKRLSKSIPCLIDWKKRGLIPYLKISNKVYYDWNEVINSMRKFEGAE